MFWRDRRGSRLKGFLALVALGLLIWTRLRLVSSIPRTVYADPPIDRDAKAGARGEPVEPRAQAEAPGER